MAPGNGLHRADWKGYNEAMLLYGAMRDGFGDRLYSTYGFFDAFNPSH